MTKLWIVIQCEIWVWALPNNLQITMNTPECPPNDIEWHEGYCFRKSVEQLFPWASAPMTNDHPAINQSLGKVSMPRLCLESVVAPRHWHPSQLQVLCQFFHCQRATKVCVLSTGSCKVKSMSCTGGSTWDSRSLSLSLHSRPQQRVRHTNGRVVTRKVLASRYWCIKIRLCWIHESFQGRQFYPMLLHMHRKTKRSYQTEALTVNLHWAWSWKVPPDCQLWWSSQCLPVPNFRGRSKLLKHF